MLRMALPILVGETVVLFAAPFAKIAVGVGLAALYQPQGAAVSTRPQLAQKPWPAVVGVPHCGQKRGRACAIVYLSPLLQINVQIPYELIVA